MQKVILPIAAVCMLLPSLSFAQVSSEPAVRAPGTVEPSVAPGVRPGQVLPVPSPSSAGLNKTASDGVSTITVPAVPCSTSARETDGTTTCVGIPGRVNSTRTTGSAR